jgi:3-dehydrosphinganine reductase
VGVNTHPAQDSSFTFENISAIITLSNHCDLFISPGTGYYPMKTYTDRWQGKVSLITGGSSGIGLAIAQLLAAQGSHVWLIARRPEVLATAFGSLPRTPDQNCGTVIADVSDPNQVASAVEHITRVAGIPDLLFNSAGVVHPGYFQDLTLDLFHWMMDVNYFGTVNMTKAVLPLMINRRAGHIVNISSVAGFVGVFGYTAYCSSKFAVRGFSDSLRTELKPFGIKLSIAYPPDTQTPQLVYESPLRLEEQKFLNSIPPLPADTVARDILHAVARGKYVILTGHQTKLIYFLSHVLNPAVYPIMDWLVASSRRKKN